MKERSLSRLAVSLSCVLILLKNFDVENPTNFSYTNEQGARVHWSGDREISRYFLEIHVLLSVRNVRSLPGTDDTMATYDMYIG